MTKDEAILKRIAGDVVLGTERVKRAVALLDEGNTVPFIARYRKEVTEGMTDEDLRSLADKLRLYRNLEESRENILRHLSELEVLTSELEAAVNTATTATELDDIYRPYRPKKRTRAIIARERGLEGLAHYLLQGGQTPISEAQQFINEEKNVLTVEDALGLNRLHSQAGFETFVTTAGEIFFQTGGTAFAAVGCENGGFPLDSGMRTLPFR